MMKTELLMKKANEGYIVCHEQQCPLHEHCLRWQVGQHVPSSACTYTCVNPNYQHVATSDCPMYRKDEKVRFAKGMKNMFNDDMPKSVQDAVKYGPCRNISASSSVTKDGQQRLTSTVMWTITTGDEE